MSGGTGRWKPYPAYKDSGVEWLGQVPEGWEVKRLKYSALTFYGLSEPPEYQNEGTLFIRATDLHAGKIFTETILCVDHRDIPQQKIFWLRCGDIIVVRSGAYTGDSAIVTKILEGSIAGFDMILRSTKAEPQFVQWALLSSYLKNAQIDLQRMRAAQPHLNADQLKGCHFISPPLPEQRAIAAFLDQQCAQIDDLITNKRRMLDLLDEKRRAIITQAVTRGLDPSVPMKDSGVAWLGQVPVGWEIGRVAFGYNVVLGKMLQPTPKSGNEQEVPYYRAVNVQWESVIGDVNEMWATPEEIEKFSLREGDLLVCEGGEVGRAAIIDFSIDEPVIIQNALHRVRPVEGFSVKFLLRILEHVAATDWFSVLCNKATLAHFTGEKFKALKCPFPPLTEQRAIADYLDAQTTALDAQKKNLEKSIDLLREYRASLITHAVTGKIDVRDFVPAR